MRLNILGDRRLPIVVGEYGIHILLDSGATIPVWVDSVDNLVSDYNVVQVPNLVAGINGFGGDGSGSV